MDVEKLASRTWLPLVKSRQFTPKKQSYSTLQALLESNFPKLLGMCAHAWREIPVEAVCACLAGDLAWFRVPEEIMANDENFYCPPSDEDESEPDYYADLRNL